MTDIKLVKNLWEQRSKKYKNDLKGVLPKAFPDWLNSILHKWMYGQIKQQIKDGDVVLDLGCGYGRLALEVKKEFPASKIFGLDIAKKYVELFNKNIGKSGKAYAGDIRNLPFKSKSIDVVYMVTTLMYLTNFKDQEKAISEIKRVLKLGGKFVFIERNPYGHNIMTLGGLITLLRGRKNKEIESVSFTKGEMENLLKKQVLKVRKTSSFPFGRLEPLLTWSLYISYSGVRS